MQKHDKINTSFAHFDPRTEALVPVRSLCWNPRLSFLKQRANKPCRPIFPIVAMKLIRVFLLALLLIASPFLQGSIFDFFSDLDLFDSPTIYFVIYNRTIFHNFCFVIINPLDFDACMHAWCDRWDLSALVLFWASVALFFHQFLWTSKLVFGRNYLAGDIEFLFLDVLRGGKRGIWFCCNRSLARYHCIGFFWAFM